MPPLESIEPLLFEVEGDRTVSRDAFDLPPATARFTRARDLISVPVGRNG